MVTSVPGMRLWHFARADGHEAAAARQWEPRRHLRLVAVHVHRSVRAPITLDDEAADAGELGLREDTIERVEAHMLDLRWLAKPRKVHSDLADGGEARLR